VRTRLAALAAAVLVAAPAAAEGGLDEVLACVRKNAPRAALEQSVELVSVGRDGRETTRAAKLYAKRSEDGLARVMLRVEEPADLRGTTFLLVQKAAGAEMYVFLPEIGKVKRVSARQVRGKLLGSDFSYEELERVYGQAGAVGAVRLPDGEREGRPVYAIEATGPEGSAYVKVVTAVDRETCVPLEVAFYAKPDAPAKVMSVDPARITREGEVFVPRVVRIRDLEKQTESRLVTHAVRVDPDLSDSMFTPASLEMRK
jgi:hypothetical protein